jgi:high-affinity K+ transport system ATPase subunit B
MIIFIFKAKIIPEKQVIQIAEPSSLWKHTTNGLSVVILQQKSVNTQKIKGHGALDHFKKKGIVKKARAGKNTCW